MVGKITIISFFLCILAIPILGQTNYSSQMPHREALAKDVEFWKQIFAKVSVDQFLIHDSEKLEIVYRLVSFDSSLSPKAREKITDAIKDSIAAVLEGTAKGTWPADSLVELRKNVLRHFGKAPDKGELLRAANKLRAQQGIREKFMAGVRRSYAYLPHIRQVFVQHKLPEFLVYLPHVESSFTPNIVSHVGAAGMWQFMRATARSFMKVNRISDERYDPYKSTHGAAKLLAWNYKSIGDWALAITAYNHGLAGMKRAKKRYGSYMEIREKYLRRSFGFASKNFYPELIAVVEIMDSVDVHFPDLVKDKPQFFQEIKLPRKVGLPSIARRFKISIDSLKQLNSGYRKSVWKGQRLVPAKYTLRLPLSVNAGEMLAALGATETQLATTTMVLPQPAGQGLVLKQLGDAEKNRRIFKSLLTDGKAGIIRQKRNLPVDWTIFPGEAQLPGMPELIAERLNAQNINSLKPVAGFDQDDFTLRWVNDTQELITDRTFTVVSTPAEAIKTGTPIRVNLEENTVADISLPKPAPVENVVSLDIPVIDLIPELSETEIPDIAAMTVNTIGKPVNTHQPLEARLPEEITNAPIAVSGPLLADSTELIQFKMANNLSLPKAGIFPVMEQLPEMALFELEPEIMLASLQLPAQTVTQPVKKTLQHASTPIKDLLETENSGKILLAKSGIYPPQSVEADFSLDLVMLKTPYDNVFPIESGQDKKLAKTNMVYKSGSSFVINLDENQRSVPKRPVILDETMIAASSAELSFTKPGVTKTPQDVAPEWTPVAVNGDQIELTANTAKLFLRENLRPYDGAIRLLPAETLGHLAEWLKVPVWRIRQLNSIRNSRKLKSGQKIILDFRAVDEESFLEQRLQFHMRILERVFTGNKSIRLKDYRVKPGDNLWKLASKSHKFPVNLLLYFNEYDKLERLYPGDVVRLPVME